MKSKMCLQVQHEYPLNVTFYWIIFYTLCIDNYVNKNNSSVTEMHLLVQPQLHLFSYLFAVPELYF